MLSNAPLKARLYRRNAFSRNLYIAVGWNVPTLNRSASRQLSLPSLPPKVSQRDLHSSSKQSLFLGDDTIYAISTAPGRAGIAIIRISGLSCLDVSSSQLNSKPF
jgi:tRNA modification GTPase